MCTAISHSSHSCCLERWDFACYWMLSSVCVCVCQWWGISDGEELCYSYLRESWYLTLCGENLPIPEDVLLQRGGSLSRHHIPAYVRETVRKFQLVHCVLTSLLFDRRSSMHNVITQSCRTMRRDAGRRPNKKQVRLAEGVT
jgi:hypothetical protein